MVGHENYQKNFVSNLKSNNLFDESFKFVLPGYNLRPLEMSGNRANPLKKLPKFLKTEELMLNYLKKL